MTPWEKFKKKLADGVAKAERSLYDITAGEPVKPDVPQADADGNNSGPATCSICSGPMESPPFFRGKPTGPEVHPQCVRCDRIPREVW